MHTNEELAIAIQNGNQEAMEQLWRQCYGYIRLQAIRWAEAWDTTRRFDMEDLLQSGYFALCDAVRAFQPSRGNFISILAFYLKTEFSKAAGCRTQAQRKEPLNNAISLETPTYSNGEDDITIGDTLTADEAGYETVEDALRREQVSALVREAVNSIPARQSESIRLYYLQGKTQSETAEEMNVSMQRAQQIIKDGLKSLRRSAYLPTLAEAFYNEHNYFRRTGLSSWKYSGMSAPERAVIDKENMEEEYWSASWAMKVSLLLKYFDYPIEKAQVIATLDSFPA